MTARYSTREDSHAQLLKEKAAAIAKLKADQPQAPPGHDIMVTYNPRAKGGGATAKYVPVLTRGRRYGRGE